MKKKNINGLITLALSLSCSISLIAQQPYITRQDPKNPKRTLVEYKPIVRKAAVHKPKQNALDAVKFTKPPLLYRPFEMKNPETNKPLNPMAKITIKVTGKSDRVTTVQQYFNELNELEKALNQRGRTLRVPATFADLKPSFTRTAYTRAPKLTRGFATRSFNAPNTGAKKLSSNMGNPGPASNGNDLKDRGNMQIGKTREPLSFNWNANLYIAKRFENHGQPEFPAEWVKLGFPGRQIYPVLVQVPKGVEATIRRIDWQVSDKPFDGTLKEVNVPGVKLSGSMNPVNWANFFRGVPGNLHEYEKYKYAALYIPLEKLSPSPILVPVKKYYIRTICYNQAGEMVKISSQVAALYGEQKDKAVILGDGNQYNNVPTISYQFPDTGVDLPFGVFVTGNGLQSRKEKTYKDEYDATGTVIGYKLSSKASFGVKYFNFMSIVDPQEPVSKPLTIVGADFKAVLGMVKASDNSNEEVGIAVTMTILDEQLPAYKFTTPAPNIPNSITLEKNLIQPLEIGLVDMWFMLGPVPFHVTSKISGEGGVNFSGTAINNKPNFEMTGSITPYLNVHFDATAGVDALIAYANISAAVKLIDLTLPMTFNSNASNPLSFSGSLSGLQGGVFLKAGFFYPCPDVGKIVGWLVGDEKTPLCECKWEYTIFDFGGFSHSYNY